MNTEEIKRARRLSISNRELLIASIESNVEKIDDLIKVGADVNFKDRDGNTPLNCAVECGDEKVLELLLKRGALTSLKNSKDETALDICKRLNKYDMIKILKASSQSKSPTLSQSNQCQNEKIELELTQDSTIKQQNDVVKPIIVSKREKTKNAVHGNIYQLKLLMLFLYRGVSHKYSFRLGTEIQEAKKFDDLVFEYKEQGKKMYRLLQAKHRLDENKKINAASLLSENDGDYSLMKYFFSYLESKKDNLFKDGLIQDVTICTNIDFDINDLERKKISVERIVNKDEILDVSGNQKGSARYKFSEDIVQLLKSKLQFYHTAKFKHLKYSDYDIKDFLKHLVFAVNQPNEEEVGCIVKSEISKEFDFITAENVYNKFFITMLNWLQGKEKNVFLSYEDGKEFFEEINRGIQFWFGVKAPVESFTGRTKLLDYLHKIMFQKFHNRASQFVCISGLGGVGKSELARKYISEFSQEYDNKVVWINAESYEDLAESFRRLACDQLRISIVNADSKEKKISSIVEDVYTFFSDRKCLFIFDNAEKYKSQDEFDEGIEKFLPFLPADRNKLHVLITSRNQKWPKNVKVIPVSVFDKSEAIEFIKKSLDLEDDAQCKEAETLVDELQLFPLALQQAVAYIRMHNQIMKNVGSKFNISDYLKKCKVKTKEFLSFNFPDDSGNDYAKTIYSTWNITFDAIKQKEGGNNACKVLEVLAYFAPVDIPTSTIVSLVRDETKLASAIEILKQYSMVNVENATLTLHRLVLKITRLHLQDDNREEDILFLALTLFGQHLNSENIDHAISVWNHSSKYEKLMDEFAPLASNITHELLENKRYEESQSFGVKVSALLCSLPEPNIRIFSSSIATESYVAAAFLAQGKYSSALKHFEYVYEQQERIFGPDSPESMYYKKKVAEALTHLGKYKRASKFCEELIATEERLFGKDHPDVLSTKHNLATVFFHQGRYKESLSILQDVLKTEEVVLGKNHPDTLDTKNAIASVLATTSNYEEALQMSQEALRSGENHVLNPNDPKILDAKFNSAGILMKQGKYDVAIQTFTEVYELMKENSGENHPDVLNCRSQIAAGLRESGRLDESLQLHEEVLDKLNNTLGPDHPEILKTEHSMAHVLFKQNKCDEALQLYDAVLKKSRVVLGNEHRKTLDVMNSIGDTLTKQKRYDEALTHYRQTLKVQLKILGEYDDDTLSTQKKMAIALSNAMRYDEAITLLREILDREQVSNPAEALSTKITLAQLLRHLKKNVEALQICREVLDVQEANLGKEHESAVVTKYIMGEILCSQGKHSAALKLFREVSKSSDKAKAHIGLAKLEQTIKLVSIIVGDALTCVKSNNSMQLKFLLENGGDVNSADEEDRTLLHYSIDKDNASMTETLVKMGADVTLASNKGNTPLHIAALKRNVRIVDMLLRNVGAKRLSDFVNAKTLIGGATALHVAAKKGALDVVKSLLKHGAIYDLRDNRNETPLELCKEESVRRLLKSVGELLEDAKKGNAAIIDKLERMRPDLSAAVMNARNSQGNTLLQVAILNKHADISRKLSNKLLETMKKTT